MIEKYLTSMNTNRWIDYLDYNSSYHSSIKRIPERLEIFDEVDLIRATIAFIKKGDFVRLLNKRGAKELKSDNNNVASYHYWKTESIQADVVMV
jgi:hypothetical protein